MEYAQDALQNSNNKNDKGDLSLRVLWFNYLKKDSIYQQSIV